MIRFSLLYKYNLFFTCLIFLCFLSFNADYSALSLGLAIFGAISSAVILYLILYLALFLFSFIGRFGLYFTAVCFALTDIALILDFFIFRLYHFHINAMVLNILTSPKAAESIDLGAGPVIVAVVVIVGLFLLEIFLVKHLLKKDTDALKAKNKTLNKAIILPLFLIIVTEKLSYGFASLYLKANILNVFKVIPLYQPVTFNRFAKKHFGISNEEQLKNYISSSANLHYPKKPITFKENLNKVNVFIIASDSVNANYVNQETAPNIEAFKRDALVFQRHYSGGNSTRFGIFSLLYGLNASYWFSFKAAQKGPVLFDVLKKLGYNINIVSTVNTSWPEFMQTAYVNIQDKVYDDFDTEDKLKPWQKDEKSAAKWSEIIKGVDSQQPQFTFLFLDAPHGYSFPKSHEKYPVNEDINYLTISKESKDLESAINSYKNAIFYNDMLFGKIIAQLKAQGLYDNSIIVYTSDHGQEFFEYGAFGHNSSFSEAQTKVPFIVKLPNSHIPPAFNSSSKKGETSKLSSHLDLVPTILSYIGVANDTSDYASGYDLLDEKTKRKQVFIANWNNNAIKTDEQTFVFSNLPNKMFNNEVRRNSDYKLLENASADSALIMKIMEQNGHFYQ